MAIGPLQLEHVRRGRPLIHVHALRYRWRGRAHECCRAVRPRPAPRPVLSLAMVAHRSSPRARMEAGCAFPLRSQVRVVCTGDTNAR